MSNASALFRSLLVYGLCLPLAVFLGYLLANPLDYTTIGVVGVLFFIMVFPLLLRWHHFWLIAAWNTSAILFFVPSKPPVWMAMAAISLAIGILQYTLNRNMKFLSVPSVARPVFLLIAVVLVTMRFTGGIGIRSFGSETNGGRNYIELLGAIVGYFAITNLRIPPKRVNLYVALYFLGSATAAIAELPGRVPAFFNFLFLVFPVSSLAAFEDPNSVVRPSLLSSRMHDLSVVGASVVCWMLARYGLRGILDIRKPWRLTLIGFFFVVSLFGGFRSAFLVLAMILGLLFYLERLHRTGWLLPVIFGLLAGGGLMILFMPHMPYSVQRSFAVVPFIPIDPAVKMDVEASSEWRIQMWRDVAPEIPQHLIVGKGYAFSQKELAKVEMRGGTRQESMEMVGNYHNGPLSVILPFGIPGSIAVVWLFVAGIRVLYRNYQFGDPALRNINTFLFAQFVVSTVCFFAIFGALQTDMHGFLGILGLGISLNGGVAKPGVAPQPKIVFNRFKLHPSVRRPAGA